MKIAENSTHDMANNPHFTQQKNLLQINVDNIGEKMSFKANQTGQNRTGMNTFRTATQTSASAQKSSEEKNVLFEHNAELLCYNKEESIQWVKIVMQLVAESNEPLMFRVSMKNDEKTVDELLTVQMQFKSISKTTMEWSGGDMLEGEMQTFSHTTRFKNNKICVKFSNVLQEVQKKLKMQRDTERTEETIPPSTIANLTNETWSCTVCNTSNRSQECQMCDEVSPNLSFFDSNIKSKSSAATDLTCINIQPNKKGMPKFYDLKKIY